MDIVLTFNYFLLQEVLIWLTKLREKLGGDVTDQQLRDFIWSTLKSGQVLYLKVFFIESLNNMNVAACLVYIVPLGGVIYLHSTVTQSMWLL